MAGAPRAVLCELARCYCTESSVSPNGVTLQSSSALEVFLYQRSPHLFDLTTASRTYLGFVILMVVLTLDFALVLFQVLTCVADWEQGSAGIWIKDTSVTFCTVSLSCSQTQCTEYRFLHVVAALFSLLLHLSESLNSSYKKFSEACLVDGSALEGYKLMLR